MEEEESAVPSGPCLTAPLWTAGHHRVSGGDPAHAATPASGPKEEGAGAHGLIISKRHSAPVTPVVVKSSAGAINHLPIAKVVNIAATIDDLKKKGVWIYGAEADGKSLYESDLSGAAAFVVGSEGNGISRLVKEKCDFLLSIPMYGNVNSFNVSCATAVVLCRAAQCRHSGK